jgi:hypothetical protein
VVQKKKDWVNPETKEVVKKSYMQITSIDVQPYDFVDEKGRACVGRDVLIGINWERMNSVVRRPKGTCEACRNNFHNKDMKAIRACSKCYELLMYEKCHEIPEAERIKCCAMFEDKEEKNK